MTPTPDTRTRTEEAEWACPGCGAVLPVSESHWNVADEAYECPDPPPSAGTAVEPPKPTTDDCSARVQEDWSGVLASNLVVSEEVRARVEAFERGSQDGWPSEAMVAGTDRLVLVQQIDRIAKALREGAR